MCTNNFKKKPIFFNFSKSENQESKENINNLLDDLPLNENPTMKTDFMSFYSGENSSLCDEDSNDKDCFFQFKKDDFKNRKNMNEFDFLFPVKSEISLYTDLFNFENCIFKD